MDSVISMRWFSENHKLLIELIKDFKLESKLYPLHPHKVFISSDDPTKEIKITNQLDKILSKYNDVLTNLYKNENTKRYIFSDTNKISAFHSISNKGVDVDLNTYFGAAKQLAELFIASRVFFYGTSDKESKDEMKISEQIVKEVMNKIDYDILGDAYEKFKEEEKSEIVLSPIITNIHMILMQTTVPKLRNT